MNIQLGTHANKQGRIAGATRRAATCAFPASSARRCRRSAATRSRARASASARRREAGIDVVSATIEDRTRAGYYPGAGPIWVKLVAEPGSGRLLGGQIVGVEGAAKRIDVLATAIWAGLAVDELALLDLSYAPPFSGVYDPLLIAARATAKLADAAACALDGGRCDGRRGGQHPRDLARAQQRDQLPRRALQAHRRDRRPS